MYALCVWSPFFLNSLSNSGFCFSFFWHFSSEFFSNELLDKVSKGDFSSTLILKTLFFRIYFSFLDVVVVIFLVPSNLIGYIWNVNVSMRIYSKYQTRNLLLSAKTFALISTRTKQNTNLHCAYCFHINCGTRIQFILPK